jgi:hypothetical protein
LEQFAKGNVLVLAENPTKPLVHIHNKQACFADVF